MEKAYIKVENLNKSFIGVQALKDVSIEIKEGEIHCFAGENGCGKSTLIKCISGVYAPDSGMITINNNEYKSLTTQEAIHQGIQVIYQDLSVFDKMTVAENIAIGTMMQEESFKVNWKKMHEIAKTQLDRIGVQLDLDAPLTDLSIAEKQTVAICRALAQDAKVLVMDEPTTALTKVEVNKLLRIICDLKKKGIAIVFISHKLDEVFEVSDTITIFRNGQKIGDFTAEELDDKSLTYYMTGKEVAYQSYVKEQIESQNVLRVEHYTKKGQFYDVNLKLNQGDIVGLTGLIGSGRTELALSLFGLNEIDSGELFMKGQKVVFHNPLDAKKYGIALLPEDRSKQGLFLDKAIKENISSTNFESFSKQGKLQMEVEKRIAKSFVERLHIKTPSIETAAGTLSGGNQQKVVLSKWLATNPDVLILDSPTVGIDIGAKVEIYQEIRSLAKQGVAVLLISDEINELIANCNRVEVMSKGKIIRTFNEIELQSEGINKKIAAVISNGE